MVPAPYMILPEITPWDMVVVVIVVDVVDVVVVVDVDVVIVVDVVSWHWHSTQ